MTNLNKCTCVKVNKEKMGMIKAKGLNLQDLLDKAMDEELKLNQIPITQQKIDEITEKIRKTEEKRDLALADSDKKIKLLMKNLQESRDKEEEIYNSQIRFLEKELEYLKKEME